MKDEVAYIYGDGGRRGAIESGDTDCIKGGLKNLMLGVEAIVGFLIIGLVASIVLAPARIWDEQEDRITRVRLQEKSGDVSERLNAPTLEPKEGWCWVFHHWTKWCSPGDYPVAFASNAWVYPHQLRYCTKCGRMQIRGILGSVE